MIGQTISHYRILELLGGGGMGVVYKAEDILLKRTVALKFLPPTLTLDPEARERFIHEAQAASALEQANICSVHEIAEHEGRTFIVMGYYEGETLKKRIEDRRLKIEDGIDIAIQVAQGLARAHEAGIVHRDIKPANIMVTQRGEVKILDFGLAKLAGQSMLTKTGTTLGTTAYMSPEQARGEIVDARTDIWSLGVVMYEMLTCHLPFNSDHEQALVYAILNENPKPIRTLRPEVPEVVDQIVMKALAKKSDSRYQKAEDLLSDLKATRAPEQSGATIAATEVMAKKRKTKRRRILVAAGVILLVLAGFLGIGLPLLQDQALASNPRAIAFTSFENKTGDESLDYLRNVLPDLLATMLEDSKYIRATRSDKMRELMKQIGKDSVEHIERETGLLLCRRAGIGVMGVGRLTKTGSVFLAEIELVEVSSGKRVGNLATARGREVESLLKEGGIIEDLARQISRGIGVSRSSTQMTIKPAAEVGSGSMEAQRYYQRGRQEFDKYNFKDARHYFDLSVKEDSTFAIAWYYLRQTCAILFDERGSDFAKRQALIHVSRATEREQFMIAVLDSSLKVSLLAGKGRAEMAKDYRSFLKARCEIFPFDAKFRLEYAADLVSEADEAQAIPMLEKVLELDPTMVDAYNQLGYGYTFIGQPEKGMDWLERYAELQPGDPNPFHSMAECLLIQSRFDEAITKCKRALEVKPDYSVAALTLARLAFMKEDFEEALAWIDRAQRIDPNLDWQAECMWWRAWYFVWAGRLREAKAALKGSERMASQANDPDVLGLVFWLRGWCGSEEKAWDRSRRDMMKYVKLRQGWYRQFWLGLLDVQQGKMDSVETLIQRMNDSPIRELSPRSRAAQENIRRALGNALRSARTLAAGHPEEIQPTWTLKGSWYIPNPDSLTTASWPLFCQWSTTATTLTWAPIPFDILPRAYVARGLIDSAISAYERALKKPPHLLGPIIPRYYYRVARLYEQQGMKEKAIENYRQFLKVWGKADPIYKEPSDARARLAKLTREEVLQ